MKRSVNKNYIKSFKNLTIGDASEETMGFRTISRARKWAQRQVEILLEIRWYYTNGKKKEKEDFFEDYKINNNDKQTS